ncbi:MAG: HD domain-containing protein [Oscillospiraceae bacterium]|nr:HD domain-containing protein [Oscillospiraceae bacterium]
MIYTPLTKKAYKVAFEAHRDQTDKTGLPYIHHPLHLAAQMTDEVTTCVALLHDVVEDSDMTFEKLEELGFGGEIVAALRLLTHDGAVPYMDYVREIKKNPTAAKVKRADLMHNSDMTRLDVVTERDLERAEKYRKALEILDKE